MPGQQSGVRPGGGASIGSLVSGGTINRILFIDHLGALAVSAAMQFDDGTNRVALSSLSLSSSLIIANGATANPPDVGFTGDPDTGIFSPGADKFGISLGGVSAFELGNATPDSDQTMTMGRCRFDSRSTDLAYFSHRDMTSTAQFAIRQNASGQTMVNAPTGQICGMAINGAFKIQVTSTLLGFYGSTGAAQQSITGSRGGNAALADLLTKLALTGIILDTTTA